MENWPSSAHYLDYFNFLQRFRFNVSDPLRKLKACAANMDVDTQEKIEKESGAGGDPKLLHYSSSLNHSTENHPDDFGFTSVCRPQSEAPASSRPTPTAFTGFLLTGCPQWFGWRDPEITTST